MAGTVEASSYPGIAVGDRVVANSWGLSQTHHGGYAQKALVQGEWLITMPAAFVEKAAMAIGTAGYTAMLSVLALEHGGLTPQRGDILLAQTQYRGVVTACGLAQGRDLPGSVLPFILRNVTLAGIDAVNAPQEARIQAWSRLARDLDLSKLARTTQVVRLAEVPAVVGRMFEGKVRGRTVVDVNA